MALRILIIAGSAGIRGALAEIVAQDPGLEVMGSARDPFAGARCIQDEIPDVILLDTDTPRMDGLTFLRKLMAQYPLPVVVISGLVDKGPPAATEILEAGAMDVVAAARTYAAAALRFLDKSPPDVAEVREALTCILNETGRASDVVDRIGSLIKKAPPRKEVVDLNAAILEVTALTRSAAVKTGEVDPGPGTMDRRS